MPQHVCVRYSNSHAFPCRLLCTSIRSFELAHLNSRRQPSNRLPPKSTPPSPFAGEHTRTSPTQLAEINLSEAASAEALALTTRRDTLRLDADATLQVREMDRHSFSHSRSTPPRASAVPGTINVAPRHCHTCQALDEQCKGQALLANLGIVAQ